MTLLTPASFRWTRVTQITVRFPHERGCRTSAHLLLLACMLELTEAMFHAKVVFAPLSGFEQHRFVWADTKAPVGGRVPLRRLTGNTFCDL